jgi:hypothetical protein
MLDAQYYWLFLQHGAWADLVLLDDSLHPLQTYLAGQLVWRNENVAKP